MKFLTITVSTISFLFPTALKASFDFPCFSLGIAASAQSPEDILNLEPSQLRFIERLSHAGGVYKVPTKLGSAVVIRLDYPDLDSPSNENLHDVRFELFAALVGNAMGKKLPVPLLFKPSSVLIGSLLGIESRNQSSNEDLFEALRTGEVKRASLVPHFEGESGREFLDRRVGISFRHYLAWFIRAIDRAKRNGKAPSDFDANFYDLAALWNLMPEEARATVISDIESILNSDAHSQGFFLPNLKKMLQQNRAGPLTQLPTLASKHLPGSVLTQLADFWAVTAVLAVPDFHDSNWIIDDGLIMLIDLAYRSSHFSEGNASLLFSEQQHPVNGPEVTDKDLSQFRSYMTESMIENLRKFDYQAIENAAREAGLKISKKQIAAMITRARELTASR